MLQETYEVSGGLRYHELVERMLDALRPLKYLFNESDIVCLVSEPHGPATHLKTSLHAELAMCAEREFIPTRAEPTAEISFVEPSGTLVGRIVTLKIDASDQN